jgi:glycosyltransferase involved in cell wall biosynthesis
VARICIVSPGQLGSNPRVVKEASALAQAGHEVRTVTTKVMALVEPRDKDVLATASWTAERVAFDDRLQWAGLRLRQEAAKRLFTVTGSPSVAAAAISAMTRSLTAAAGAEPADLYIAHYPAALPAAANAARRHGAVYAYDAEDFHLGDVPDGAEHESHRAITRAVEARYLPGAAYVTAASPGIADAYAAEFGVERPTVLLNVFSKAKAPERASPCGTAEPRPSVYWFSQQAGPQRGLECAVFAIAAARSKPHLYIRGTLAPGFGETIMALARGVGVADRLHLLPPAPPSQMEALAAGYDVGLVGETGHTPNRRIALTNKQFTYILAGVPALMSDIPAHRTFAATAEGAVSIFAAEDPASLARAMDDWLGNAERLAAVRTTAFRLGQETFNWETEQARLIACVEGALATSAKSVRARHRPTSTLVDGASINSLEV